MSEEQQGIQSANNESLAKIDPVEAGIPQPIKIDGIAKETVTESQITQPAPIAAPVNQIAPVSSNGEQTSARTSPSADVPENAQNHNAGAGDSDSPPETPESPGQPAINSQEQESEENELPENFGDPLRNVIVKEEPEDPLVQAQKFISTIPGKFRLY